MHICTCIDIGLGSYANQIMVSSPPHMPKDNGYCLDKCVSEEVMILWKLGITTTGCCCGHGKVPPYIGVADNDIPTMKEWGYHVQHNPSRPHDEDSFIPIGKDNILLILNASGSDTGK